MFSPRLGRLCVSATIIALSGCTTPAPHRGPPFAGNARPHGTLFISPMGEPFHGDGREAAIGAWFDGADANHDASLSRAEFRSDAARFFKTLDTDGDGELSPDEVRHYEMVIAPEIRVAGNADAGRASGGGRGRGGGGHHGGGGGGRSRGGSGGNSGGGSGGASSSPSDAVRVEGAGRFGLLNIPEPVASADGDFNRSITLAEFIAAADRRFDALDSDGDGQLARRELPHRSNARVGDRKPA